MFLDELIVCIMMDGLELALPGFYLLFGNESGPFVHSPQHSCNSFLILSIVLILLLLRHSIDLLSYRGRSSFLPHLSPLFQ